LFKQTAAEFYLRWRTYVSASVVGDTAGLAAAAPRLDQIALNYYPCVRTVFI
jgi:hypothetical protein